MSKKRIRLFADEIFRTGDIDSPRKFAPLVALPPSPVAKQALAGLLLSIGLFFYSFTLHAEWLNVLSFLAIPTLPFLLICLDSYRYPDRTEAWLEPQGLRIRYDCGRWPERSIEQMIPWEEISAIVLTPMYSYRLQYRTYRIITCHTGETPHLKINTNRSLHLARQDLRQLACFPASRHVRVSVVDVSRIHSAAADRE